MSIRTILTSENNDLRRVAKKVTEDQIGSAEMQALYQDMRDTLADSGGIGLAAPQIGVALRVALFDVRQDARLDSDEAPLEDLICINPELSVLDSTLSGHWEGCLSIPDRVGFVERPQHLRMTYMDECGESQQLTFRGFLATVCQHELDHLDGILYTDRIFVPDLAMSIAEFEARNAEAAVSE